MKNNVKKPFELWEVDGVEYKLKLKTASIIALEEKFNTSLMNLLAMGESIPPLNVMLQVTHYAIKDYNHSIKLNDVYDLFDKYCEEGGSQLDFYQKVYMGIFQVSGFFTPSMMTEMQKGMEEIEK
jgi:hypothetical protein